MTQERQVMSKIQFFDRPTQTIQTEQVYGDWALNLLYGNSLTSKTIGKTILRRVFRYPCISSLYGRLQDRKKSSKKVLPFIKKFGLDSSEFLIPPEQYKTFNEFFTRKLKPSARPINPDPKEIMLPADGRYLVIPDISKNPGFFVKGQHFNLDKFLNNYKLAKKYQNGSLVLARLCPTDYHRFHFPCSGRSSKPELINGYLYSVNPKALKENIGFLWENKRQITSIETEHFGTILMIEIGATNVGSIIDTYEYSTVVEKGQEKGYFSFGGSSIVLLFESDTIVFSKDLLSMSQQHIEVRGLMGQELGRSS